MPDRFDGPGEGSAGGAPADGVVDPNPEGTPAPLTASATRAGFLAVLGAPNAGKSTLVNAMVGAKVSIVTHKVQTTRFPVRGVAMMGRAQIILVDTPGIFAPKPSRRLDKAMVNAAWAGAADADALVHVVDAAAADNAARAVDRLSPADRRTAEDVARVIDGLKTSDRRAMLALNKVDLLAREHLLALAEAFSAHGVYTDVFMISALTQSGLDALAKTAAAAMPLGPWLYPEDQIADLPQRLLAAEVTREKLYLRVHDELPYASTVETESWRDAKDGVRIEQVIYVQRESQRKIILGKGGQTIKTIGKLAREELEDMLGCRVHLFLFVKVREGWMDDRARLSALGLDL